MSGGWPDWALAREAVVTQRRKLFPRERPTASVVVGRQARCDYNLAIELCSELIFRRWQLREARRHLNGTAEIAVSFRLLSSNAYDNLPHWPANLSLPNVHVQWPLTHSPHPLLPFGRLLHLQVPIPVLLPSFPFSDPTTTPLPLCPHAPPNPVRDINPPQMRSVGSQWTRAGHPCPQPRRWNVAPLFQSKDLCNYIKKSVP